jgi:hypothetical protein
MSPSTWGPPTWIFIHTLAEKIKEESFPIIGQHVIASIIKICNNLPCPECAQHAKEFWSKVNISTIKTKMDLVKVLFVFHNIVNKRKGLRPFRYDSLKYYQSRNVIETYNAFSRTFHTKGNMNLISESFHRNLFLHSFRKTLMNIIPHFNL